MPRYSLHVRELAGSASLQPRVMPGFSLGYDGGFIEGLEPSEMAYCTELRFVSLESLLDWQSLCHTGLLVFTKICEEAMLQEAACVHVKSSEGLFFCEGG